jgi:O-antigen/teichoic acid export membrane protein
VTAAVTPPRPEGRLARRQFSWGLIDQALSSATNFSLAIVGGRLLGASGLGVIYLGFSICLLMQAMQRGMITEPLVVASAGTPAAEARIATRDALTIALAYALALTVLMLALGALLPAPYGRALLLFAPWLTGVLIQDLWRAVLFRDQRAAAAALNDGVWALGMIAAIPLAIFWRNEWTVVFAWGFGATAAGVLGFAQTRLRPTGLIGAARWWRVTALPLGRWLGAEAFVLVFQAQCVVFILTSTLGTADVGGMRAVQAVFAPMTLLAQALAFPGLPLLTKMSATSRARARMGALLISAAATALVLVYLVLLVAFRAQVLNLVFGPSFIAFSVLAIPVGVQQVLLAASLGFSVLARAEGRGRLLLVSMVIGAVATVALTLAIAPHGLTAALWAMTAGLGLGCVATIALTLPHPRPAQPTDDRATPP